MTKDPQELLSHYATVIQARKDTLEDLRQATDEIKSVLAGDPTADIGPLLERRDRDCRQLDLLLRRNPDCPPATDSDCEAIAEDIIQCQAECEAILRGRLEEAAGALRESVRRRRLDAAYGPACKHATPRFLDRQQ